MAVNPAQLAELSALLDQALDIPVSEREAWLATPPTADPTVLAALTRALQMSATSSSADAGQTSNMGTKASAASADPPPTDSRSAAAYWLRSGRFSDMGFSGIGAQPGVADESIVAGATMDRYRLLHPIGSGGMGTVWLAERIEGDIVRPVALKLPLRLSGNRQIAERFTRERGVLAKLAHPNIATLYDAGVSDAGVPFLALEYVEGLPITEYADGKWLTVAARLALFTQVLAAVQHAHESLVIHRDLKPSNILVKADGTVKLLDFGIARLIEEGDEAVGTSAAPAEDGESGQPGDTNQQSELTQQVGIAVTPNYASPEQLAGDILTTATDVYSLGVVLYELLSGARPYHLKRENQAALVQGLLDAEVVPPSQVAVSESAATLRCASPPKLRHQLSGDLDAILHKALEKTTDKRYRTAEEFAADLRRYQQHEPVQAMPSSALYRAKKYVSRNRIGTTAAAAVSLAILVGIGATLWQLRETERELARRTAVQTFLVDIFKTADPEIARGKVYTAKELLSVGVERIDKQFANQPEVAAALYGEIGMIFSALGDSKTAGELFAKKLKLLETMGQQSSAEYVDALSRNGRYLYDQGRLDEALPLLEKAVTIAPALGSKGNSPRWQAMQRLALVRIGRAEYSEAGRLLRSIRSEIETLSAPERPNEELWLAEQGLGFVAFTQGYFSEAEKHYVSAATTQRLVAGTERIDVLRNEFSLAITENELRKFDSAYSRLREIVSEHVTSLGPTASDTLKAKSALARALSGLGKTDEALAVQMDVVSQARSSGNIQRTRYAEVALIRKLIAVGRHDEAERITRTTLDYFSRPATASLRYVERLRSLLAEILLVTNRANEALAVGILALEGQQKIFDSGSIDVADTQNVVGATQRALGRFADSLQSHESALATYRQKLGTEHLLTLRSEAYGALAEIGLERPDAVRQFDMIATKLAVLLPAGHPARQQIAQAEGWAHSRSRSETTTGSKPSDSSFFLIDL